MTNTNPTNGQTVTFSTMDPSPESVFSNGDKITILSQVNGEAWMGRNQDGAEGMVLATELPELWS